MNTNEKFINAVFNYNSDDFKKLLELEAFDTALLTDIGVFPGVPCPIQWISQCWEIVFHNPEEWVKERKATILRNRQRNREIMDILRDRFGVQFTPIDFYNSDFWFFRSERDSSFDDIIDGGRENLISQGSRGEDLDLYVAVCKFDFNEAERLLKAGANPKCNIPGEDTSCWDRINTECSYLESCKLNIDGEDIDLFDYVQRLIDLIGCAAHESMLALLQKYMANISK